MKYQLIKHLKTKTKLLKMFETVQEAKKYIESTGARFNGLSYIGQFPIYVDGHSKYSIQGYHEEYKIVLGLNKEDLAIF